MILNHDSERPSLSPRLTDESTAIVEAASEIA